MKRFLRKIFLFILPILLSSYGVDILLSNILKKSNSFADGELPVWNDLYKGEINSDVVIYGSSRAWVQIDPKMINDSLHATAYNLGINGHSFNSQYFRHSLLLRLNRKPKIIIQTLDITSFEKNSDLYNPDQYLPYMLDNREMQTSTYNGFASIDYKVPVIRYYGKKEAFLEIIKLILRPESNKVVRVRGYQAKELMWNDDLMLAQRKLGSFEVKSDTSMIHTFENYLKECNQQNINIVFVFTPVFIEGQKFVINWSEIMKLYYQLSKKYSIPYFDYSSDSMSFHKEYFYNSGHLNKIGSKHITAKLINDLKESPVVKKLSPEIHPN
jgi:hypothetical protein